MNFIDNFKRRILGSLIDVLMPNLKGKRGLAEKRAYDTRSGEAYEGNYSNYLNSYKTHQTVRSCIDKVAKNVMIAPWGIVLQEGYDEDPIERKILEDFFEMPNGKDSFQDILFVTIARFKILSEAYWEVFYKSVNIRELRKILIENLSSILPTLGSDEEIENIKNEAVKIINQILDFFRRFPKIPVGFDILEGQVNPITDKRGIFIDPKKAYVQKVLGNLTYFSEDEVLIFKLPNPLGGNHGLSPLSSLETPIASDLYSQIFSKGSFKNAGRPDGIIVLKNINPNEVSRTREELEERFSNPELAYKPVVVDGGLHGGVEFQEMGKSQRDTEFISHRRLNREDISMVLNVPLTKLGLIERLARGTSESLDKAFWEEEVKPAALKIESQVNFFLKSFLKIHRYKFKFFELDLKSKQGIAQVDEVYFDRGIWSINDVLKAQGKNKLKGGDLHLIQTKQGTIILSEDETPKILLAGGAIRDFDFEGNGKQDLEDED